MDTGENKSTQRGKDIPLLLALVAAGLAGNYFSYEIFFDIRFTFGSIFSMLALLLFGLGPGVLAGACIASITYLTWQHPYTIIIMTLEVLAVGLLVRRRNLRLVIADALYWVVVGMPLVILFHFGVMHLSLYNASMVMLKQALNGIANTLAAQIIFIAVSLRWRHEPLSIRDVLFDLLVLFCLLPSLFLISRESANDMSDIDRSVRRALALSSQRTEQVLNLWLDHHLETVTNHAGLASSTPVAMMQKILDQTLAGDKDFLRIGLLDKNATTVAFSPLIDELGKPNRGRSFKDRPFIPIMQQTLKPMLTEVVMGKVGMPKPAVSAVAPVIIHGRYAGYVVGVLDMEKINGMIANTFQGASLPELGYILVDKNNKVIANSKSIAMMTPYSRIPGGVSNIDDAVSLWLPPDTNIFSSSERWNKASYFTEMPIGRVSGWRLILEQPMAPFQKRLHERYAAQLAWVLGILLAALAIAEIMSRRITAVFSRLRDLSSDIPRRISEGRQIEWSLGGIAEANDLVRNFRGMTDVLGTRMHEISALNAVLQERETVYRSFFEQAAVGVVHLDAQRSMFLKINDRYCEIVGYSRQELEQMGFPEITHPDDLEADLANMRLLLAGEIRQFTMEKRYIRRNGSIVWVVLYISSLWQPGEQPTSLIGIVEDITERKNAEQALQDMNVTLEQRILDRTRELHESEERFRSLFEKLRAAALVIDPETGALIDANSAAAEFYGWSRDQLRAKKVTDINIFSPEEVQREMEASRSEQRSYFLFRHRLADGSVRDVEVYSGPVRTGGKTVLYSIVHDITERRRVEVEKQQISNELQVILNTIAIGIIAAKERKIIWTNPMFLRMYGFEPEEARRLDARRLYAHQEDYERIGREGYPLISEGQVYATEAMARRKDGSIFWLSLTGSAVNPGDPAEGSIWMLQDITERKLAEAMIKESEANLNSLINCRDESIWSIDSSYNYIIFNSYFKDAYRAAYRVDLQKGMNAIAILPPDVRAFWKPNYDAALKGQRVKFEFTVPVENEIRTFAVFLNPIVLEGNISGVSALSVDITESKYAEEVLREKTRQLQDLTMNLEDRVQKEIALRYRSEQTLVQQSKLAAMGEMLGAIAHQWRQPLNSLGMIIQNMRDAYAYGELNPSYLEQTVQKSMAQIQNMSRTIDDFRTFFLPDKERSMFDSMQAVGNVLSLLSAQLAATNIRFRLVCNAHGKTIESLDEIQSCPEKTITGYRNEFEHVIMNLINNAREAIIERRSRDHAAAPERGLIVIEFNNSQGAVIIKVVDNGIGIGPEVLDRVFEPYFTAKDPAKGTGLGLYMSKVIIEDHMHGKIFAANGEQGAVFTIQVPQA